MFHPTNVGEIHFTPGLNFENYLANKINSICKLNKQMYLTLNNENVR